MRLPSVISLKAFIKPSEFPNFTRFNVFLRDKFTCLYCGAGKNLTFDHVIPKSKGGQTSWENVASACSTCNVKKGGNFLRNVECTQKLNLINQQKSNFTKMVEIFLQTFFIKVGSIIFIGMLS